MVLIIGVLAFAGDARAECPTTPDDPVCRPWSAVLLPTAYAGMYMPREGGTFYGGGLEAILLAWSDNSEAFGPSQGRIRADVGVMTAGRIGDVMETGNLVMYRTGAQLAFERNASRPYGIPYFAVDVGGLWSEVTGRRWFVDAGIGVYLVHKRSFIVDAEVTGLVPFQDPGTLGGITSRLALSFSLW
ncbi:MAG TPA: hypothetical protein VFQ53_12240 [Kofleriaceae bacterium]|nr:hypothetical protein [Kofleriaceae bacterium]